MNGARDVAQLRGIPCLFSAIVFNNTLPCKSITIRLLHLTFTPFKEILCQFRKYKLVYGNPLLFNGGIVNDL